MAWVDGGGRASTSAAVLWISRRARTWHDNVQLSRQQYAAGECSGGAGDAAAALTLLTLRQPADDGMLVI